MRYRILSAVLFCLPLQAALSVTTIGTTNTSIAVKVSGAMGGDCTIELWYMLAIHHWHQTWMARGIREPEHARAVPTR